MSSQEVVDFISERIKPKDGEHRPLSSIVEEVRCSKRCIQMRGGFLSTLYKWSLSRCFIQTKNKNMHKLFMCFYSVFQSFLIIAWLQTHLVMAQAVTT